MRRKVFCALLLTLLSVPSAFAAHPLVTDDTGTHGTGRYQLELNGEFSTDRQVSGGITTGAEGGQLAAIISAGLGETVDLIVGIPCQWTREKQNDALLTGGNGVGDASLEIKWRFFEREGCSLAVKPGMTVPTGDEERGFGTGRISGGIALITTWELAPLTMNLNASYLRSEYGGEVERQAYRRDIWRASVAVQGEIARKLQLAGEVGLESNSDRSSGTWPVVVTGGVIYSLRENLDLDFGVRAGLNDPAPDLGLLVGMALHF